MKRAGHDVRPRSAQSGFALLWLAVFLLTLLAFTALAVDGAKLAATKTQLQNAADAAALAGASAVDPITGLLVQETAVARAQLAASRNFAYEDLPTPVVIGADAVTFPTTSRIRVEVERSDDAGAPLLTHLASVIGFPRVDVRAAAEAWVHPAGTVCDRLTPFGAVRPITNWFSTACESVYVLTLAAGTGQQGNYQLLALPTCPDDPCGGLGGAARVRCILINGYSCCVTVGQQYDVETEPGLKVGAMREGLGYHWNNDTDQRTGICYPQYQGNGMRVLWTPVVESFDVNGRKFVNILGFSAFFMREPPGGGPQVPLTGNFITDVVPGTGDAPAGNLLSLRLVR